MKNTFLVFILILLFIPTLYPQRIPYKINELPPYGITYEDALNKWGKPTREGHPTFLEYKQDEYTTLFYFKPANSAVANLESIHFGWRNISEEQATDLFYEIKYSLKEFKPITLTENSANYKTAKHDVKFFIRDSNVKGIYNFELIYLKQTIY
jgi:hypothetical protein